MLYFKESNLIFRSDEDVDVMSSKDCKLLTLAFLNFNRKLVKIVNFYDYNVVSS